MVRQAQHSYGTGQARHVRTRRGSSTGAVAALFVLVVFAAAIAYGTGALNHALFIITGMDQRGQEAIDAGFSERIEAQLDGCYAYKQLDAEDQLKYRIMYAAFSTREEYPYPESDEDDLSHIRECVLADHPELFYVMGVRTMTTSNSMTNLTTGVTVHGDFSFDENETDMYQNIIDDAVEEFVANIPEDADDYEKSKMAYRYIVDETEYDLSLVDDDADTVSYGQTIKDVFVDKRAVCAGYAAAYQYLMEEMGIECVSVSGDANDEAHAWCIAWLDGEPYYVDPTWGDPVFLDDENAEEAPEYVNFDYLDVTTDDIEVSHTVENSFDVPECTSEEDNYYVREDLLFEWADTEKLGGLVADSAWEGGPPVQIRCSDEDVYYELLDGFIASGALRDYISDMGYRYSSSDGLHTIAIFPDHYE